MDIPLLADRTKQVRPARKFLPALSPRGWHIGCCLQIAADYGVLINEGEDAGASLRCVQPIEQGRATTQSFGVCIGISRGCRGLFIISDKGILRQITVNDLPVRFAVRPKPNDAETRLGVRPFRIK